MLKLRQVDLDIEANINDLSHQGQILHFVHHSRVNSDWKNAAWWLYFYLKSYPQTPNHISLVGNDLSGYQFIKNLLFSDPAGYEDISNQFISILKHENNFSLIFQLFETNPDAKHWASWCILRISEGSNVSEIKPEWVWKNWNELFVSIDRNKFNTFISNLKQNTELLVYVSTRDFDSEQAGLYVSLVECESAKDHVFRNMIIRGLKEVENETWIKAIKEENYLLYLVYVLRKNNYKENGYQLNLDVDFKDALREFIRSIMAGIGEPKQKPHFWKVIVTALANYLHNNLQNNIRDDVETFEGDMSDAFFDYFGDEISAPNILSKSNRTISHIFIPLLKKRKVRGLEWNAEIIEKSPTLLGNNSWKDFVIEYRDLVQKAIDNDPEDDASPLILRIANVLSISKKEMLTNQKEGTPDSSS